MSVKAQDNIPNDVVLSNSSRIYCIYAPVPMKELLIHLRCTRQDISPSNRLGLTERLSLFRNVSSKR